MISADNLKVIDEFWCDFFGISEKQFASPEIKLVAHKDLADFQGVFCFKRANNCIISAPKKLVGFYKADIAKLKPQDIFVSEDFIESFFANEVKYTAGPATLYFLDKNDYQPMTEYQKNKCRADVRLLLKEDEPLIKAFYTQINPQELHASRMKLEDDCHFGCFKDDVLVSLASFEIWNHKLAHLGIATHQDHRGNHYGKRVLDAITQAALQTDMVILFRTLNSNDASLKLAESLGYQKYGETAAFTLNP